MTLSTVSIDTVVGRTIRHAGYGTSQESPMDGRGFRRTVSHPLIRFDEDFGWSGDAVANTCLSDSGGPMLFDAQVLAVVRLQERGQERAARRDTRESARSRLPGDAMGKAIPYGYDTAQC